MVAIPNVVREGEAVEPPLMLKEKLQLEREILAPMPYSTRIEWVKRFGEAFQTLVEGNRDVRRLFRHPELLLPDHAVRHEMPKLAPVHVLRYLLPELIEPARVVRRLLRRHP